ncbi:response regulator transcription factor [Paenibacillus sp. CMAA1364]
MMNVFLVDDEPLVLEGLRTMIHWEKYGFQICGETLSGLSALKFIQDHKPELVITDINMPVFNGLELITKVNQTMTNPPKFIILSGYDDFKYAQTAMKQRVDEYLLKPIDDEAIEVLLAKMSITIANERATEEDRYIKQSCIANSMVNRLIKGEFSAELELQVAQVMNLHGEVELTCILIETSEYNFDLQKFLGEYFSYTVSHFFSDDAGRRGVLIESDCISEHRLREEIYLLLQQELVHPSKESIFVSISGRMRGIQSIQTLYLQAMTALEMRYHRGNQRMFCFSDFEGSKMNDITHMDVFKQLLERVVSNDSAEIDLCVREAFTSFSANCSGIELVKRHVANLELSLCRRIVEVNGEPDTIMQQQQLKYGNLENLDFGIIQEYVYELCMMTATYLVKLQLENEDNTIYNVIRYVDREFHNKLQLQDLARRFHMNATYLGQLFKRYTGQYYNEYLNQKRIEEAERLLKRTQLKVSDIANRIGYPSTDYFVSKFKMMTGMVPSEYRNKDDNN